MLSSITMLALTQSDAINTEARLVVYTEGKTTDKGDLSKC